MPTKSRRVSAERLLIDTAFIQALLNRHDRYHAIAVNLFSRVQAAREAWITEAVLLEVGNALSVLNRQAASDFIRQCYTTANMHVVQIETPLLLRALDFTKLARIRHGA
ncbi:MAG TPA: hypothetical protein VFB38_11530 [Chthonomonadaceae bacterium]|nr:hypothetical protein [Chthonomonadaceae bacterium]